ncbi:hypothetical protein [Bacillus massiliglaciei]|uniref:hypothetical protein n=1 Tax=Bacillus massiliglaciei TaxID=1816693 RepID=UPI0018FE33B2|nr:hypothetical protein [Bacillus massiliglaciei]
MSKILIFLSIAAIAITKFAEAMMMKETTASITAGGTKGILVSADAAEEDAGFKVAS